MFIQHLSFTLHLYLLPYIRQSFNFVHRSTKLLRVLHISYFIFKKNPFCVNIKCCNNYQANLLKRPRNYSELLGALISNSRMQNFSAYFYLPFLTSYFSTEFCLIFFFQLKSSSYFGISSVYYHFVFVLSEINK